MVRFVQNHLREAHKSKNLNFFPVFHLLSVFGLESPLGIFPPGIDPSKMYNPLLDLPDPRSMHPDHTPFLKKKREYLRRLNPLHSALISAYINRRQIILFVNTFRGRYGSLNFAGGDSDRIDCL